MNHVFQWTHRMLRVCPICGSPQAREFLLCPACEKFLWLQSREFPLESEQRQHKIFSCWQWIPDRNRPLSVFLDSLKRHPCETDWRKIAELHSTKMSISRGRGAVKPDYFVPCAPSDKGKGDHAFYLAKALSEFWQVPMLPVLESVGGFGPQKTKSKWERAQRQYRTNENFSRLLEPELRLVFVDDVVTSGATAQAAFECLGRPPEFEVWCLAHRQLAGDSSL